MKIVYEFILRPNNLSELLAASFDEQIPQILCSKHIVANDLKLELFGLFLFDFATLAIFGVNKVIIFGVVKNIRCLFPCL